LHRSRSEGRRPPPTKPRRPTFSACLPLRRWCWP